jgi:hypothetical protein
MAVNRRGFLGALLAAPVAVKLGGINLPVLVKDTPQEVIKRARVEFSNNCWKMYDENGTLRVQLGVW